eukprot:gene19479-26140_t
MPTKVPAAARVVALGDLHGDLQKALRAFRLAKLIDDQGSWIGGETVCVQHPPPQEAAVVGGHVYVLIGNHETMNVASNHRYCTAGSNLELARWARWQELGQRLKAKCCPEQPTTSWWPQPSAARAASSGSSSKSSSSVMTSSSLIAAQQHFSRTAMLQPGSVVTKRFMADHPLVLQVGSSMFVHGGILPAHVEYGLEKVNKDIQSWFLEGDLHDAPSFVRGATSLVWARDYSAEDEKRCDCAMLKEVLQVVEILDDKIVRRLHETTEPELLGTTSKETQTPPLLSLPLRLLSTELSHSFDMDASPCCWICLGDEADYRGRLPEVICGCSTRPAHATCMSRWRLQRAGTFEEKICSSCLQDHKTAWYDHLIDDDLMTSPINPVMAVVFKGTTRMIKVKLGPEGKVKFERTVKDQFGIPQYLAFDVVFDVKAPGEDTGEGGQGLTLKGIGAFDAVGGFEF